MTVDSNKSRKIIAFDLDTDNLMMMTGSKTKAYDDIRKFMENHGFSHRQGSVYISTRNMPELEVMAIAKKLIKDYPYLEFCMNDIRCDIVQETQSILPIFQKDYENLVLSDIESFTLQKYPSFDFSKEDLEGIMDIYHLFVSEDTFVLNDIPRLTCLKNATEQYIEEELGLDINEVEY